MKEPFKHEEGKVPFENELKLISGHYTDRAPTETTLSAMKMLCRKVKMHGKIT